MPARTIGYTARPQGQYTVHVEMQELSGYGLRRALLAGIARVLARRDELNRINVFPVPDGDTGTNLAFTLSAVLGAVQPARQGHAGELMRRAASEAIDGARGNSGAILAQFLQGVSEGLLSRRRVSAQALADAAGIGSRLAREALAEPREGTILSVIQAFAAEWRTQVESGVRDLRRSFEAAVERARVALRETPQQLAVLRAAGVVDAGAMGFVDLLEGIDEFIRRGRAALREKVTAPAHIPGVDAQILHGTAETHRYCTECMVNADPVDRLALKGALLAIPLTSLVLAGTRDKVRVHAHTDDPGQLFEVCGRFGRVSSAKADDMIAQAESAAQSRARVAIVTDSGADLPVEEMERLNIHLVPVRVSIGARDFLDKVSLSSREFFAELRDSPVPPRTSQPPPGDFRRLFEFLLSHHERLIYVGLSRALSGTLQSGESAAARVSTDRAWVIDSRLGAAAQGLLAMDAAAAAAAGFNAEAIAARVRRMIPRTQLFGAIRDLSYGVRGGRAPRFALPLSRLLGMHVVIRVKNNGKLGLGGALWGREHFAEHFGAFVARKLDPAKRYRVLLCHCDCAEAGATALATLRARANNIDAHWLIDAGSGIGAHAGPGSLIVGLQEVVPLELTP